MPVLPTDIIQSFRLRFWREPDYGVTGAWRGDVWHEQQKQDEFAVAVASPDQAFDLIRNALAHSVTVRPTRDADDPDTREASVASPETDIGLVSGLDLFLSIWRRLRGERS